jgi:hypothetical protein
MMRLDTITLAFAREVIEEETGTPLDIQNSSAILAQESKLVARDDKKNPLISTFEWADDAVQRIMRVPAGFMRNKTQERIEELARERAVTKIDLGLVEEGIEIGKKMMAEMIATYQGPPASVATASAPPAGDVAKSVPSHGNGNGAGYLNEVSPLTARSASDQ